MMPQVSLRKDPPQVLVAEAAQFPGWNCCTHHPYAIGVFSDTSTTLLLCKSDLVAWRREGGTVLVTGISHYV
jgi:hypothetical protein